jgi:hypothetical protein
MANTHKADRRLSHGSLHRLVRFLGCYINPAWLTQSDNLMTVDGVCYDPASAAQCYTEVCENVSDVVLSATHRDGMMLVNRKNAYGGLAKAGRVEGERCDLLNVRVGKLAIAPHALPIPGCTKRAISDCGALDVQRGASKMLVLVDAIRGALIANNRMWIGAVHEHERVGTGLKTTDADEWPVVLRAIFLSANNNCAVMLCGAAKQHHRTTGCEQRATHET